MLMRRGSLVVVALAALALVPAWALAQTNSQIAGQVLDDTGGVLPGVTVEASSPVLIEGSRIVFTDGAGRYTLVDLRPGTYALTFTLPGFTTTVRNELVLAAGFTMAIDVEMVVGGVEESITVSGETPVVDVQSTRQVEVLNREVLEAVPTGRNMQSAAQLIVGIKLDRPEVGLSTAAQQTVMMTHGMSWRQVSVAVDGLLVNGTDRDGGIQNYHNQLTTEEMSYETGGMTAETSGGGVRINMIPREGGNQFSGQFYNGFSNNAMARDHTNVPESKRIHPDGSGRVRSSEGNELFSDFNVAQGGPIVRSKLWFFSSFRRLQVDKPITDSFYRNFDGTAPRFFDPDPVKLDGKEGRELFSGIDANLIPSILVRLTYQASPRNKFAVYMDRIWKDRYRPHTAGEDPATGAYHQGAPIYYTGSAKWTSTLTNRMLLEAGYSSNVENWSSEPERPGAPKAPPVSLKQVRPDSVAFCPSTPCYHVGNAAAIAQQSGPTIDPWYTSTRRADSITNFRDRNHWSEVHETPERFNYNVSLSYVTGSHNMKVGVMNSWGVHNRVQTSNADLWDQRYRDGVPFLVNVSNLPFYRPMDYQRDMGIYAQDSWTVDRLTLNLGVRWEQMLGRNIATSRIQSRFVPGASFPGRENLPNWKDIAPRMGVAYDLFGDATTALKFSWGRYNASNTTSYSRVFNPVTDASEGRDWFDCALSPTSRSCASQAELAAMGFDPNIAFGTSTAGTHTPGRSGTVHNGGTNGDDYVQDWEIGVPLSSSFGRASAIPTEDPNGIQRPWVGLMNLGIDRQLRPGLSVTFNWYRREIYDPVLQYNRALVLTDYTKLTIANPCAATGLGPTGFPCSTRGIAPEPTLDIYNLNANKQNIAADNFVTNSNLNTDKYNGFETGVNARLPGGVSVFGGWSFERNISTRCDQRDNPNRLLFCDQGLQSIPWLHDFKISGMVPLPGGFQVSGSAQFYPAQEASAGGAAGLFGGTNQGGSTFDDVQSFAGDVSYSVPTSAFTAQGVTRTQALTIPLMPNGALFADRLTQIDMSVRKSFNLMDGVRWDVQADVYNVFNLFPITRINGTFGSSFGDGAGSINRQFLQLATHLHW